MKTLCHRIFFLAVLAIFALGGCTVAQWKKNPAFQKIPQYSEPESDRLTSFRLTQRQSGDIPAGTLIMIGEKYWYLLDQESSKELTRYVETKLSHGYIFNKTFDDKTLTLTVADPASRRFTIFFDLRYENPSVQDRAAIKARHLFSAGEGGWKGATENDGYFAFISLEGHYYPAPVALPEDRALSNSIPINIRTQIGEKNKFHADNFVFNVLTTPGNLLGDILLGAVILPVFAIDRANDTPLPPSAAEP